MSGPYLLPKKGPIKRGQLRSMAWRALLPAVVSQDDPTWAARCKDYWERQERLYGIRLSSYTMILDTNEMTVTTFAVVMDVLPGERTTNRERVAA